FSSRRRHTISKRDWSSDVCSSDLGCIIFSWHWHHLKHGRAQGAQRTKSHVSRTGLCATQRLIYRAAKWFYCHLCVFPKSDYHEQIGRASCRARVTPTALASAV